MGKVIMITDENDNIIKQIVLTENETEDEFIFETISNWMSEKKQITVSKQELVSAVVLQRNLVRCKDCANGEVRTQSWDGVQYVECHAHEEEGYDHEDGHPLDWFCADGKRKDT